MKHGFLLRAFGAEIMAGNKHSPLALFHREVSFSLQTHQQLLISVPKDHQLPSIQRWNIVNQQHHLAVTQLTSYYRLKSNLPNISTAREDSLLAFG